jgi:HEPN domain-containing protein
MPLAREFLQRLAESRLREGRSLLDAGHHSGAYYLAGYAVELALKACIAKQFKSEAIPDWPFFRDTKIHKLLDLVGLAGLQSELRDARSRNERFDFYWEAVTTWKTDSRYEETSAALASQLMEALEDPDHGVMRWIRTHW